ncbi:MAG: MarC family protein [Candidatus Micrarchaeia archaeon]
MDLLNQIAISFITIFLIMDPFASIPPFIALTKGCKEKEMRYVATRAVIIACLIAVVFMFGGSAVLSFMGVTLNDLKVAGGIVLGLLGLENVLGFTFTHGQNSKKDEMAAVAVIIATPLLSGPGLISTLMVLKDEIGLYVPLIALALAFLITWIMLLNASRIRAIAGDMFLRFLSKVIGLLLIALSVSFIKEGLMA